MSNVVYLQKKPDPITTFIRVGGSGHRQLEQLLMSGRLPVDRLVLDASAFDRQRELVKALKESGRELALDTNVAELSSIGRFQGFARTAPWANHEGVLTAAHMLAGNENHVLAKIAEFAVVNGLHRVHAPSHFLSQGAKDPWLRIDLEACERLRRLLDAEGGRNVAIDYPLLITNATLNDREERAALAQVMSNLPIASLWLRISGFGADATAAGVRKYIEASRDFQALHIPLVSDGVGGMAAFAIAAFGAASGLAHGVAEKERFDASSWNKPPKEGGGGGGSYAVLLPGIDRLLKKSEAEALLDAPHARRLFSCMDRRCCPGGFEDTLRNPKAHYLRQRRLQCDALAAVPEPLRAQHYLDKTLSATHRTARDAVKLKISNDPKLAAALGKNSVRLQRMRDVLEDLHKTDEDAPRAQAFRDPPSSTNQSRTQSGEP